MKTPDLLKELAAIARAAHEAREKLNAGEAATGHSALRRIEYRAEDAVRHWHEDQQEAR